MKQIDLERQRVQFLAEEHHRHKTEARRQHRRVALALAIPKAIAKVCNKVIDTIQASV